MKKIYYKKKIDLSEKDSRQLLTLGDSLIEKGFLRDFSGAETKLLLYLLTHLKNENKIEIELPLAAGSLGLEINEIKTALDSLQKTGLISALTEKNENIFSCFLALDNFLNKDQKKLQNNKEKRSNYELRRQVIKSNSVSKNELAAALISFLAPDNRNIHHREEIKSWLNDFEPQMLKELVRRVDKWLQRQGGKNHIQGAYAYLKAIIDSWYQKEITSYKKLQKQDKLYRETRELAQAYGINSFSSNTAQLKTFQSWLTGEQALSKELALAAIREAVKRKRDGQPSLKYVEDNFINPVKELNIKNLPDFRRWLQKVMDRKSVEADSRDQKAGENQTKNSNNKQKINNKKNRDNENSSDYKWKDFFIDFDKFKE